MEDFRTFIEPLPRQPHDDRLQLLVGERHATIRPHTREDQAAFVELSRTQAQTRAIMHQHFHSVRALVDKKVRMMSARFTEHTHNAGQRFIYNS